MSLQFVSSWECHSVHEGIMEVMWLKKKKKQTLAFSQEFPKSLSGSEIPTKKHYSVLEQLDLKLDIYQKWSFVNSNYFTEIKHSQLYY